MSAIQQLLADPGLESPLNVDAGNLLREDDEMGMESLVRFWTCERRWQGEGQAGWISERNDNVRGGGWGSSTAGHLDPTRQTVNEREADAGVLAEKGGRESVSLGAARSGREEGGERQGKQRSGGEGSATASARDSRVSVDSRSSKAGSGRDSNSSRNSRPSTARDESGLDIHGIPKRSEVSTDRK